MISVKDKVRFVETDMMGVAHHANYLRWFEMGRVAYLRACGINLLDLLAENIVFPITEVNAKYKNPLTFDDEFEIQVTMKDLNKAKMDFAYKVIRSKDQAVCVEGMTRNLFTNKEGKIVRLPAKWFDKIKNIADKDKAQV